MYPSKIHLTLVQAVGLFFLLTWHLDLFTSLRPETKNRMHLDRFVCEILNSDLVASVHCNVRHISMANLKVHFDLNATRPLRGLWFHVVFYHKFNGIVYNKFPIDVWESFCEFVDGNREKTYALNWLLMGILPFSNFNHSCPYANIFVKADNVSMEKAFSFTQSIVPSGRYRQHIIFTEDNRVPFFRFVMFGSIAEHQLDKI